MISTVFTFHISTPRMQRQEDGPSRIAKGRAPLVSQDETALI